MAQDIANLVLAIDSTQVRTGTAALDGLTAAGGRAEAATVGLGAGVKAAGAEATTMAAAAQASAQAAMAQAASFTASADAARINTMAMRETLVVARELARGNLTRIPGSLSLLAQGIGSQGGIGAYASALANQLGLIRTVEDAELSAAAASAQATMRVVQGAVARAGASITAADAELLLAQAAVRNAEGSTAEAAAQARLVAAHEAVAAAAAEAGIAETAMAEASATSMTATAEANAAAATSLTSFGVIAAAAAAAGIAYLIYRLVDQRSETDKLLDKMKEHYQKTLDETEAAKQWAASLEGVAEAMQKVADGLEKSFTTDNITRSLQLADAQTKLNDALQKQKQAQDELAHAKQVANAPGPGTVGFSTGLGSVNAAASADVLNAERTLRDANAAVANAQRAIRDLQITAASEAGKAIADISAALKQNIEDAEAMLQRASTGTGASGAAIRTALTGETTALEKLRSSFDDADKAGDKVQAQADALRPKVNALVDSLVKGSVAPEQFTKQITAMAAALEKSAQAALANKNPIEAFEKAVIGAEGTGPNKMGSSASGYGQFLASTWLTEFNKVYPSQAGLSDQAKLALRDNETVAKGIIDAYARENAKFLEGFGATVTAANLYLAHWFGSAGAKSILTANPNTPISDILPSKAVQQNKLQGMTAGGVEALAAKRIGDVHSVQTEGAAAVDKALKDQAANEASYAEKKDDLNKQILDAERKLTKSADDDAQYQLEDIQSAKDKSILQARQLLAEKKITPAEEAKLEVMYEDLAFTKSLAIEREKQIKMLQDADALAQQQSSFQIDALKTQDQLATSQAERQKLQLEILDLTYQEKLLHLETLKQIAIKNNDLTQQNLIQGQIDALPSQKAQQQALTINGTLDPLQAWAKQVPHTADMINEALQSIEVKGFDGLASAIAGAVTGTESLGKAFKTMATSIISDIVQMTVKMLIFRAISSIFGQTIADPLSSIQTTTGGAFGATSFVTGSVAHLASGGSMIIGGNGGVDNNVLSLNGSPFAMVGQGERLSVYPNRPNPANSNSRQVVEIHVVTDENFNANVQQIAGTVVVQAAPQIIAASAKQTIKTLQRPAISGGR